MFLVCDVDCKHCLIDPQECDVLKTVFQGSMNQGIIVAEHLSTSEDVATLEIPYDQVEPLEIPYDLSPMIMALDPVMPLTITIPTPFPIWGHKRSALDLSLHRLYPWIEGARGTIDNQRANNEHNWN